MRKTKLYVAAFLICVAIAAAQEGIFKIGIIGTDTSHATSFTKYINKPDNNTGFKVTAAYPGGSPDIEKSISRIEGFTKTLQDKYGVEIVVDIETLCKNVDGIMLLSVDGRTHLEQLKPVLAARKPVFIDKPIAASLADAIQIFRLAQKSNVPCWSSSSLRFTPAIEQAKTKYRRVLGCSTYSPCTLEEHHPDLYWYGIHGVEMLFTLMGPGCQSVQRTHTADFDYVVGVWSDGRIGTYRGLRSGKTTYGGMVFGTDGIGPIGDYEGYDGLVQQILNFFKTGIAPVNAQETIEIYAFMTAADKSKTLNGAHVSLASVLTAAEKSLKE